MTFLILVTKLLRKWWGQAASMQLWQSWQKVFSLVRPPRPWGARLGPRAASLCVVNSSGQVKSTRKGLRKVKSSQGKSSLLEKTFFVSTLDPDCWCYSWILGQQCYLKLPTIFVYSFPMNIPFSPYFHHIYTPLKTSFFGNWGLCDTSSRWTQVHVEPK